MCQTILEVHPCSHSTPHTTVCASKYLPSASQPLTNHATATWVYCTSKTGFHLIRVDVHELCEICEQKLVPSALNPAKDRTATGTLLPLSDKAGNIQGSREGEMGRGIDENGWLQGTVGVGGKEGYGKKIVRKCKDLIHVHHEEK